MQAAILNAGSGAWVFEEHAQRLAGALRLEVSATPADYNYLLGWESPSAPTGQSFIPFESIRIASDKRRLAAVFASHQVATPRTYLLTSQDEVEQVIAAVPQSAWVLKWPIGCGGSGHRLQAPEAPIPPDWPRPYVLQEFVHLETPEVYRLYAVAGETFGWNARRFPSGATTSPFVAHAQGARYADAGSVPPEAELQARQALAATGLLDSFGCADLMRSAAGEWLVLEVNTDGLFSHIDRDINLERVAAEIDQRLACAFWNWVESQS